MVVLVVLNGWVKVWSDKDVCGYLGYYVSDFEMFCGVFCKEWVEECCVCIEDKGCISVKVSNVMVSINGNIVIVCYC